MAGQGRTDALQRAVAAGDLLTARLLAALADRPVRAALALTALVLALHLPGVLLLPPLDRTEVIYAQTARQLLETDGAWTAPQFQNEPKFEKPLAVLWLQGLGARASRLADDISGYRLPSVLGTILAVLFTYTGARRIYGARAALLGAALLATMLVMAVHGTLAMPETLMLAATCAAMWAMGRAYTVRDPAAIGHGNALVFWIALGSSVLVNVATVPVIAALTALMLFAWDRGEARWLKGLVSLPGIALALALAVLWPLALYLGGSLDAALAQWRTEGAHLLLGPQEMKWRVVPGLFAVFLLLGLFPAGLFLGPALVTAWRERTSPAVRFLVAWILPYLIFLELFTRKTPLYMVQAMLPPLALLLALWVVRRPAADAGSQLATTRPLAELENDPEAAVVHRRGWFRVGAFGWLLLVAGLVIALWVLPFLLKLWVSPVAVVLGLMTLVLAVATTAAMLAGHRLAAAATLVVMAVAFNNLAIPVTFAGLGPVWVSSEIRAAVDALRPCHEGDIVVAGHTEPSAVFELGRRTERASDGARAAATLRQRGGLAVVGAAQREAFASALGAAVQPVACVAAYDFIKTCAHRFAVFAAPSNVSAKADARCSLPQRFDCAAVARMRSAGRPCK